MISFQTAVVFPGQGSQSVGMLAELAAHYDLIEQRFAEVSERLGYDLWHMVQAGPEAILNQTEHTQAAMLTADVVVFELLEHQSQCSVDVMAGHSLGEYAALVASGALELADAAELVTARGRIMQQAVPLGMGAMAAIVGLSDEAVVEICCQATQDGSQVTPANYNAVGQVVIAGHTVAVERAIKLAEQAQARLARLIPVSVPCHCPLLMDAARQFSEQLQNTLFHTPRISVISNVDLSLYHSPEQIRTLLTEQLYKPVRWVETIQKMKAQGISLIIECGPGKVLSGLVKRIDTSLRSISVNEPKGLHQAVQSFNE